METAQRILEWFGGREDVHAQQPPGHSFRPVKRPITTRNIQSHLEGRYCCGFYLVRPDNTVTCACLDVDNHNGENPNWRDQLPVIEQRWRDQGLPEPCFELSQSGEGCHVWLFFLEPVQAWWARETLGKVIEGLDPLPEIYPKQDEVADGKLGNLIRYPLWNKSKFLDQWPTGRMEPPPLALKPRESHEDAPGSAHSYIRTILDNSPESLLARRWRGDTAGLQDQSKSAVALSLCCEMVWYRLPTDQIAATLREWCQEHGYEKGQRDDWIRLTVDKAYELYRQREDLKPRGLTVKEAALRYLQQKEVILYESGIQALDDSIGGVSPGEMLLLAARPSNAKSALGVQWCHEVAKRHGPALILSAEMSYQEIGRRATLELDKRGILAEQELAERYDKMHPIYLEDDCPSVEVVYKLLEQHVRHHGIKMAFVDYAQLLQTKESGTRYEKVTYISQKLREAAKAFDIALVVAAQMSREIEKRSQAGEDWDPTGSDLKESGQLEQDADKVLFLAWPLMTHRDSDPNDYMIKVFKNRNGEIKKRFIRCRFYADRQAFE